MPVIQDDFRSLDLPRYGKIIRNLTNEMPKKLSAKILLENCSDLQEFAAEVLKKLEKPVNYLGTEEEMQKQMKRNLNQRNSIFRELLAELKSMGFNYRKGQQISEMAADAEIRRIFRSEFGQEFAIGAFFVSANHRNFFLQFSKSKKQRSDQVNEETRRQMIGYVEIFMNFLQFSVNSLQKEKKMEKFFENLVEKFVENSLELKKNGQSFSPSILEKKSEEILEILVENRRIFSQFSSIFETFPSDEKKIQFNFDFFLDQSPAVVGISKNQSETIKICFESAAEKICENEKILQNFFVSKSKKFFGKKVAEKLFETVEKFSQIHESLAPFNFAFQNPNGNPNENGCGNSNGNGNSNFFSFPLQKLKEKISLIAQNLEKMVETNFVDDFDSINSLVTSILLKVQNSCKQIDEISTTESDFCRKVSIAFETLRKLEVEKVKKNFALVLIKFTIFVF